MNPKSSPREDPRERLWRSVFFGVSAAMGGFALVDLDAGRLAGAAGDIGVACLLLSLMNQFPVVRAILDGASKREPPERLRQESERLRSADPWSDRLASVGWSLLFGSLLLRVLGVD